MVVAYGVKLAVRNIYAFLFELDQKRSTSLLRLILRL